ncbi:MAG: hypothetical protein P1P85_04890 [Patescibacteria group bacterium]|nr:hypothetical protein [Patescibacteria group bacterium]
MEDQNTNRIYIKSDEEISSIINKISQCDESEIILVVPENALLLQNVINLKIIKKKAEEENKKISIIKSEIDLEKENSPDVNIKVNVDKKKINSIRRVEKSINDNSNPMVNKNSQKDNVKSIHFPGQFEQDSIKENNINQENPDKKKKVFDIVKRIKNTDNINKINNSEKECISAKEETRSADNHYHYQGFDEELRKNIDRLQYEKDNKKAPKSGGGTIVSSINSKMLAFFVLISLVAVSLAIAFVLPKADINIILKAEPVSYDFEFMIDDSLDKIDFINNKIPSEKIEVSSEESGEYSTTGKKHLQEKASGEITVFNEYSSSPQRIVENTRFLSKTDNKLFRIKEAVTIPGFLLVEGVDVPGQVTITVYADKVGEEYNIGSDSFHLPGLQGSAKYATIYARSIKPMSGGIDKEVQYFSESDYITAKENLLKLAKEKNDKDFLNKTLDQSQVLDLTKKEEDVEITTDIEIGEVVDSFKIKVIAKTSAISILKSDLNTIIDEKINSRLDTNKKLLDNSRRFEIKKTETNKDGKIVIFVHVNQSLIAKIDIDKLKEEIADKSEEEIRSYFINMNGSMSTDVIFWPFWVKSTPASYDKINVTIDINNSI